MGVKGRGKLNMTRGFPREKETYSWCQSLREDTREEDEFGV